MSTEQNLEQSVKLPEGVTASLEGRSFAVKGKLGTIRKDFARINVEIQVEAGNVLIRPFSARKKDYTVSNTVHSLVRNMVKGVTRGYTYRLNVVYAHFPISVKTKGDTAVVYNFVRARSPRGSRIVGHCRATTERDDV